MIFGDQKKKQKKKTGLLKATEVPQNFISMPWSIY